MRDVIISIEGITPYSASQYIEKQLLKGETDDAHERRRWREKAHTDESGQVYIPGVAFKMAVDRTAQTLNEKIKGKGNQTYTGVFQSGIVAMSDVHLGINVNALQSIRLMCSSTGNRRAGKRVPRYFPYIPEWGGILQIRIFNDSIPEDVFERYFEQSGMIAGVGRGRPETGCAAGNGRYRATKYEWK